MSRGANPFAASSRLNPFTARVRSINLRGQLILLFAMRMERDWIVGKSRKLLLVWDGSPRKITYKSRTVPLIGPSSAWFHGHVRSVIECATSGELQPIWDRSPEVGKGPLILSALSVNWRQQPKSLIEMVGQVCRRYGSDPIRAMRPVKGSCIALAKMGNHGCIASGVD